MRRRFPTTPLIPTLLMMALLPCCRQSVSTSSPPQTGALQISCALPETEFSVGEDLPPPVVTIDSNTREDVELVGPTISVIACALVQPDGVEVPMRIAMPTGRSPYDMPKRVLSTGDPVAFTPRGIWTYRDGTGYTPYRFPQAGTYELLCRYEELISNVVTLVATGVSEG